MTASLRSRIGVQLGWTWRDHVEAAPITDSNRLQFDQDLGDGDGTDQAQAIWHVEDQMLASGDSTMLDLAALPQPLFGGTLTLSLVGVRAILIVNKGTGDGFLLVGGAAADPWYAPLGAADDRVKVMPGGALLLAAPRDGWAVEPNQARLLIAASGGNVTYDIAILGSMAGNSSSGA
jgi:hypothetical protein